ncbi:general transcription factor ii-i repeat domain-containing 2-like protein [Plakobranchus ocellatus]|uniref:General transcription factor ii-i repeat domain-containing 2-like protein n=1 Tax=Plakobranchus ocellatus TaxID=259542 RepID=A0AAV3YY73_9GAST|nr:general transcription factor ii-i repeat domain-containing 2-like protein [Plakobranchus ocellatus]
MKCLEDTAKDLCGELYGEFVAFTRHWDTSLDVSMISHYCEWRNLPESNTWQQRSHLPIQKKRALVKKREGAQQFCGCLSDIWTFLERKIIEHPELADFEWILKFYYLMDMTEHLNQLNVKRQGVEIAYNLIPATSSVCI